MQVEQEQRQVGLCRRLVRQERLRLPGHYGEGDQTVKRKLFRWAIDVADRVNIFFKDVFNIDPKRRVLESKQDLLTMKQLDATIGKALGAKPSDSNKCDA